MQDYDAWKLENGYSDNDDSFEEVFKVSGENSDDFNQFENEFNMLLEKYGYKREL